MYRPASRHLASLSPAPLLRGLPRLGGSLGTTPRGMRSSGSQDVRGNILGNKTPKCPSSEKSLETTRGQGSGGTVGLASDTSGIQYVADAYIALVTLLLYF